MLRSAKFIFIVLVGVLTFFPILTFAESITNLNGIVISEEEYNNFLKLHTHEQIMLMDEEKYEKLKSLDYSNVRTEVKYVATTYNPSLNLTTERELSKAEYDSFSNTNNGVSSRLNNGSAEYETTAKGLIIAVAGGTTWNYTTLTATWKYIPTTRSFDVIGFRGYGFEFREGSQQGDQVYILDGNYTMIDYAWDGTNIKRLDNGFGISMNIVNSNIQALQLMIECDIKATESYPTIYGSYQHAVSNISLADSQNYTLGGGGLGSVFIYPYSIVEKYDGMSGVRVQY